MHASQARHISARVPAIHGRAAAAGLNQQQQRQSSKQKPWRKLMLVCCAGAQTPKDVDDPYEDQQNSVLVSRQHQQQQRMPPVEAPAAPGPTSGLPEPASTTSAHAPGPADLPSGAPAPAGRAAKADTTPRQAFPTAVGATRSLLDGDLSEETSSSFYQVSSSSTPVAGVSRLRPLTSPTAAAAATADSSTQSYSNTTAASRIVSGASAQSLQQALQQRKPTTSSGDRSPSSPTLASPFTNKLVQGRVAAELTQHKQQAQRLAQECAAPATAAAAAGNAEDSTQLPALPVGLHIKTGRKAKAACDRARGGTAAASQAACMTTVGHTVPTPQQQERQFSLQHWNSELEAAAAAARASLPAVASAEGPSVTELPAQVHPSNCSEFKAPAEDSTEVPPVSPRHITYTASMPPRSPPYGSSKGLSSSTAMVGGSSGGSTTNSSDFDFTRSGVCNAQNSTSHNWAISPLHSSNSAGYGSFHTAPGHVTTKASVIDYGRGSDQVLTDSAGFQGFDSAGLWVQSSDVSKALKRSAASAPVLQQQESDSSSPFVHQQFTDLQQLLQQPRGWSTSLQQQGEWSSSSQQQQQMSQSDEAEEWCVQPVLLSPLRIPSHREKAVEEADDLTPLSPKMSVVGVSNSVINNLLSEEGFPLVPTEDDHGVSDLFAGTPRAAAYSGMFSNSFSNSCTNRSTADAAVPDTPRRLRAVQSETGAAGAIRPGQLSRRWQTQQQQQPRTRRHSGTYQRSRAAISSMRRPASSDQLRRTMGDAPQLAASSEENEGAAGAGGRYSSSIPPSLVRPGTGRRLYGAAAGAAAEAAARLQGNHGGHSDSSSSSGDHDGKRNDGTAPLAEAQQQCCQIRNSPAAAAASGSSSLASPQTSWPGVLSYKAASAAARKNSSRTSLHSPQAISSNTSNNAAAADVQNAAPIASSMNSSITEAHSAFVSSGQLVQAAQPKQHVLQADVPAAAADITSSSSSACGPAGVSYSRLRDVSRSAEFAKMRDNVTCSSEFARAGGASARAGAPTGEHAAASENHTSRSLLGGDPSTGKRTSLYMSGANGGGSGVLFSRTAWAALGRQPIAGGPAVQTLDLVAANAPAGVM